MKHCNACGAENKPEAKFCKKCGAPISMIAAVASNQDEDRTVIMPASRSPAAAPQGPAAAAPRAPDSIDAILPPIPPAPKPAQPAAAPTPSPASRETAAAGGANRAPLLLGLGAAALAVLAAGAYFVWTSMDAPTPDVPAPVVQPQQPAPAAPTPPSTPPVVEPAPAAPVAGFEAPSPPPAAVEPPPPPPSPAAVPPAAAPAAATPAPARARPAPEKLPRSEKPKKKEAEPRPQPAAAPPAPVAEPEPKPAPAPEPPVSRWTKMQEELRACGTFNVFCREQVRWKYCAGHWGKVPDCPASGRQGE